jgi:hypothetical protein
LFVERGQTFQHHSSRESQGLGAKDDTQHGKRFAFPGTLIRQTDVIYNLITWAYAQPAKPQCQGKSGDYYWAWQELSSECGFHFIGELSCHIWPFERTGR